MHPVCTRTAPLVGRKTRALLLLFPVLLAAACQTLPPPGETAVLAESVRADVNVPSAAPRYRVDPQASEMRLLIYRDGPLARFGHNHVVVGRVHGEIRAGDAAAASGFRLEIPVDSFAVDPPAARAEEGDEFAAHVTLRGLTRDLRFAAAVLRQDDMLVVVASFRINQSEFGIEPFTALNGGLRVRDPLDIRV